MELMQHTTDDLLTQLSKNAVCISTGYSGLDKVLGDGLSDKVYLLGSEPGTGKSAFLMSIAQHIAESGKADVLYFTQIMNTKSLVVRGVSQISFEHHLQDHSVRPFTASDLSYTDLPQKAYKPYLDEYGRRYGEHIYVIDKGDLTADVVAYMAEAYKQHLGTPMVVLLDCLQALFPDSDDHPDEDTLSSTLLTLQRMAASLHVPVIVASSILNTRGHAVSQEHFADLGYSVDSCVLLGWNWDGVTNADQRTHAEAEKEKRNRLGYRHMTLEVLNPCNEDQTTVLFRYYPGYSHFIEFD